MTTTMGFLFPDATGKGPKVLITIDSVEFSDREDDEGVASDFADIVTQMAQDGCSSPQQSTAESNTSTSKLEEELKIASQLRKFAFNDLKMATRNFRPDSLLCEWELGFVFKGGIEENGTTPVKSGTGGASGARNARP
ncbi:hypothetical protein AgCh_022754 [Apium graveolens]